MHLFPKFPLIQSLLNMHHPIMSLNVLYSAGGRVFVKILVVCLCVLAYSCYSLLPHRPSPVMVQNVYICFVHLGQVGFSPTPRNSDYLSKKLLLGFVQSLSQSRVSTTIPHPWMPTCEDIFSLQPPLLTLSPLHSK